MAISKERLEELIKQVEEYVKIENAKKSLKQRVRGMSL